MSAPAATSDRGPTPRSPRALTVAGVVGTLLVLPSCGAPTLRSERIAPVAGLAAGELLTLPVPHGATAGSGEISPDGRYFAYEAGLDDHTGELWVLHLASRRARRLAAGQGRRSEPTWAPDGARLAYATASRHGAVDAGLDGIYVLHVESSTARRIFRPEGEWSFVHAPRWHGRDSIVFSYSRGDMFSPDEPWIAAADGSGARRIAEPGRYAILSPSGAERAFFAHCCDTWGAGLWVAAGPDEERRCLAGPLGHGTQVLWSTGGRRLFFRASPPHRDSVVTLWTATRAGGGGSRVDGPAGGVMRISASDDGLLAVPLRARNPAIMRPAAGGPATGPDGAPGGGRPTSLWLVSESRVPTLPDRALPACPSVDPAAAAFARGRGIRGELRIRETFRLPGYAFREFEVDYRTEDGRHARREGVDSDGHLGWIRGECTVDPHFGDVACPVFPSTPADSAVTFSPRPDEGWLWSTVFLGRLAESRHDRRWLRILLAAPDLPAPALDSLMAHRGYDDLLVEDPRVRGRPDLLLAIYERQRRGRAAYDAFEALWLQGPAVVADPATPHEFLRAMAQRVPIGSPPDRPRSPDSLVAAIGRALIAHPWAGRDTAVLLDLARLAPSVDSAVFRVAGRRLLVEPSLTGDVLRLAAPNLAADSALAEALFADPRVVEDPLPLVALARTRWHGWRVAERARLLLRELRAAEDRAARNGPARQSLPLALPDAWAGHVDVSDSWSLHGALVALDPIAGRAPTLRTLRASRAAIESALCERAVRAEETESDLARIAEGAVYATSTRVAACLLENPSIGGRRRVLRSLATMIDVNHERYPGADSPTIAEVRARARTLLERRE